VWSINYPDAQPEGTGVSTLLPPPPMRLRFEKLLLLLAVVAVPELDAQSPLINLPRARPREVVVLRDTVSITRVDRAGVVQRVDTILEAGTRLREMPDVVALETARGFWSSATLAYEFARGGDDGLPLTVGAQLVLNTWRPRVAPFGWGLSVPIIGNVARPSGGNTDADSLKASALEIAAASQGIYAGIAPTLGRTLGGGYAIQVYGEAVVRSNTLRAQASDSSVTLTHGRFAIGAILAIGEFETGTGQLSIELSQSRFAAEGFEEVFGTADRSVRGLDVALILPINEKVGILGQYVRSLTLKRDAWRFGATLR